MISLDTTRADHFGCYGNNRIQTPNIDKLANESILFENCITSVPTTLPSHMSLFTGKYPHNHGTPRNGFKVNDDNMMLAEILQNAGFHTIGFIGAFVLSHRFNFAQGFDYFDESIELVTDQNNEPVNERKAEKVTNAVIDYLDKNKAVKNMFLFVHYFDPHIEYSAPPPYEKMYDHEDESISQLFQKKNVWKKLRKTDKESPLARAGAARYAGEITYMDKHIGRLLDYLTKKEILKDALLVVTSDHGENLWHHKRYFNHGWTVFQPTIHSVCIIRLPDARHAGKRIRQLIGNIDVFPTVLNYLGLEVPGDIDGEKINFNEPSVKTEPRIRFCQASKPYDAEDDSSWYNIKKARCIYSGNLKFIQTPYLDKEELYDLAKDPGEELNLLKKPTKQISKKADYLRKKLEKWAHSSKPLPSNFISHQKEDTIKRLQSLGYLQ